MLIIKYPKLVIVASFLCMCICTKLYAQKIKSPVYHIWEKEFTQMQSKKLIPLTDGGYLYAGISESNAYDIKSEGNRGESDYWAIRMDANWNILWEKTIGGSKIDELNDALELEDGSILLGGYSESDISGDKTSSNKGKRSYWVVKLDREGKLLWDKTFGGDQQDMMSAMLLLPDGNILLGGTSDSDISGDKSEASKGQRDYWIINIDADGNKHWDRSIGGNSQDKLIKMILLSDGNILLGGQSYSGLSGDKSEDSKGSDDYWIFKLDLQGNKIWDKTIGGRSSDSFSDMIELSDGSLVLGGSSYSQPSGDKSEDRKGNSDYWLVKLDDKGEKLWDRTYGAIRDNYLRKLLLLPDGKILCSGWSNSSASFDKSEDHSGMIATHWMLCLEPDEGDLIWDKTLSTVRDWRSRISEFEEAYTEDLVIDKDNNLLLAETVNIKFYYYTNHTVGHTSQIYKLNLNPDNTPPILFNVWLRDASTTAGKLLQEVKNGDRIPISRVKTNFFSFEVKDTSEWSLDSMVCQLKGENTISETDKDGAPYTFFGKNESVIDELLGGRHLSVGAYQLTVTPYFSDTSLPGHAIPQVITFFIDKPDYQCEIAPAGQRIGSVRSRGGDGYYERATMYTLEEGGFLLGAQRFPVFWDINTPDYILAKIDENNQEVWTKFYGGDGEDDIEDIIEMPDGGFLLGGYSNSDASGDKSENSRGENDYWVVRVDADGNLLWEKTYGGNRDDYLYKMVLLNDGSIILAGHSSSGVSGEKSESSTGGWFIKIDSDGDIIWEKPYPIQNPRKMLVDTENQVLVLSNGSLYALDLDGNLLWSKNYNVSEMVLLSDGNLVLASSSKLIRLDTKGDIISSVDINFRKKNETGKSIRVIYLNPDGSLTLAGYQEHYPPALNIWEDWWIQKFSIDGEFLWEHVIDFVYSIEDPVTTLDKAQLLSDGSLLFHGPSSQGYQFLQIEATGTKIHLIDAQNDAYLQEVMDYSTIDPEELNVDLFSFVLKSQISGNGQLDVSLEGPISLSKSFQQPPYVLFGDVKGFSGTSLPGGQYTLKATTYCEADSPGETKVFNFTVKDQTEFEFTLVDADTESDVHTIQMNDIIDFDQIGNDRLSIRVDIKNAGYPKPDQVKLILTSDQMNHERIERLVPYALFGGEPITNYFGRNFCPGEYTIEAIAYWNDNTINSGPVSFQLVGGDALEIQTLTLVDAASNLDIETLGSEVDILKDGISVRAEAGTCAKSVRFVLKDQSGQTLIDKYENIRPYALLGDSPRGNYTAWLPEPGDYTLEVTAFTEKWAKGMAGDTKIVSFTVIGDLSSNQTSAVELYPNPSSREQLHVSMEEVLVSEFIQVKVLDNQGKTVLQKQVNKQEFDLNLSNLKTGYYILEINNGGQITRKTIIRY